ncbi:TAP Cterminal subfamily protein [Pelomyxa schiedti]|nr:TAP Cterminal subfamily protein [Pelomyxa schiedti]
MKKHRQNLKETVIYKTPGSGKARVSASPNQSQKKDVFPVMVSNWKTYYKVGAVMDFIKSKLDKPIAIIEPRVFGPRCFFEVSTQAEAMSFQALSPLLYKSEKLIITAVTPKTGGTAQSSGRVLESAIQEYVNRAYNREAKFLDLSSLRTKISVTTVDFNVTATYATLWRILARSTPQVESLSFSGNNISTLTGFGLAEVTRLKDLKNFSFSNNTISEIQQLDHLKRIRVRELDLRQNPIYGLANYKTDVERKFPQLRFLDGAEVKMLRAFVLPSFITSGAAELPPQIPDFTDTEDTRRTAAQFLTMFFDKYDKDRTELRDAYTEQSFFSMSMLGGKGIQEAFRTSNRNLLRAHDTANDASLLRFGKQQILQIIGSMPTSTHHLQECTFDSYVVQSMPGAILLCINCYGRVSMNDTSYSFTRTFLLAPNRSGIAQDVWPIVILNDQLHMEDFCRLLVPKKRDDHAELANKLIRETRLLECYAVQCLESTNWNYDEALAAFKTRYATGGIPPSAFQP